MTVSAAIFKKLTETPGVTDLVAQAVYPVRIPQGADAPYVIFQNIGSDPGVTHNEPAGATEHLFQFACFASTYEEAVALRDAVVAALDGQALETGDNPTLEDSRDGELDAAVNLFRADADFIV